MAGDAPYPLVADWQLMSLKDLTLKIGSGSTPTGGERTYLPARHRAALIRSQNVLDRQSFRPLTHASMAQAAGMPLGSVGISLRRLAAAGLIRESKGSFRLGSGASASAAPSGF